MAKELFSAEYVNGTPKLPVTDIWQPGDAGVEQRRALEAFLQQFVDAGSLIPAMYPTSTSATVCNLSLGRRCGDINMNDLLCDTQVLIAKHIHTHVPELFKSLRDIGDRRTKQHAMLFDALPVGEIEKVKTPGSIHLSTNLRGGVMADYLTASATLVMGGRIGRPLGIAFNDVVDKKRKAGRHIHNDPPEQFFILHCQRTDSTGERAFTLLHDMEKAYRELEAEEQKILKEPIFRNEKSKRAFAPVIKDEKGSFSLTVTHNLQYFTGAEGESQEFAVETLKKWMVRAAAHANTRVVELLPGQALVVDTRYLLHSVVRLDKDKNTSEEINDRWLVRSGIYTEPVYPDAEVGAFYRMPKDISMEETLQNITRVTKALENYRGK